MTCRGYDPKAVKIGKPIKVMAASYTDKHQRSAFIRGYVKIAEDDVRQRSSRKDRKGESA
jgi:hypothetical protein